MHTLSFPGASLVLTSNPLYWSLPGVAILGQTPKGMYLLSFWVFSRVDGTLLYSLSVRIVTGLDRSSGTSSLSPENSRWVSKAAKR